MLRDILNNDFDVYLYFIFNDHIEVNDRYVSLPISNEMVEDLKEICISHTTKIFDGTHTVGEYNIIGANDGEIEVYDLTANFMGLPVINNIFVDENRLNDIPDHQLKEYSYFVIEANYEGESFYFFRKPTKPSALRKGAILTNNRGRYELLKENDMIIFDDKIDFVATMEAYYIFRRAVFENSFDFSQVYDYLTYEIFENEVLKERIENCDVLFMDINENKTLKKRLANLYGSNSITLFLEQLDITERINQDYGLNLRFENENLIYEDKAQATHIVAFMQDAYYETYLGGEQGTDTRR